MRHTSSCSSKSAALPLALTAGEPAGIGPDLCLAAAGQSREWPLVCLADRELLATRAAQLGVSIRLHDYRPGAPVTRERGQLSVWHEPLEVACVAGRLERRNARQVLRLIDRAVDGCLAGEFAAMVTAPVQKSLINEAGIPFRGHTEYIAARTGAAQPVMLLTTTTASAAHSDPPDATSSAASPPAGLPPAATLRVALATTHLPLRAVSAALSVEGLTRVMRVLSADLQRGFGLPRPRIGVCGLNPHAGEGGHLGDEEIAIIGPAIERARAAGVLADGPLPADTVFVPQQLERYDVVLAMYHDQGLPVLKHAGFGRAVNVTLGLPIVRTSVDHGTALALAGSGEADAGSLIAALTLAAQMAAHRSRLAIPAPGASLAAS